MIFFYFLNSKIVFMSIDSSSVFFRTLAYCHEEIKDAFSVTITCWHRLAREAGRSEIIEDAPRV